MPGDISQAYGGMPICSCQHFKNVHDRDGVCQGEGCQCISFTDIDFDQSELGKAVSDFIGYKPKSPRRRTRRKGE